MLERKFAKTSEKRLINARLSHCWKVAVAQKVFSEAISALSSFIFLHVVRIYGSTDSHLTYGMPAVDKPESNGMRMYCRLRQDLHGVPPFHAPSVFSQRGGSNLQLRTGD